MATRMNKTTQVIDSDVKEEVLKKYANDDMIPCRSIISGGLYIEGARTHFNYTWADYGDIAEVEYQDLIYMVRTRSNPSIYEPRIIIEDEEFINQNPQLKGLYESLYSSGDLKEILEHSIPVMKKEIEDLPKGVKEAIKGLASTMIDAHQLDSVQKIKALDEIFGTQMLLTLAQE